MNKTKTVSAIWLGSRAAIWAHRGYEVRGGWVLCPDGDTAAVLQHSFADADTLIEENDEGGSTYYYDTQSAAEADFDGSRALAIVCEYAL